MLQTTTREERVLSKIDVEIEPPSGSNYDFGDVAILENRFNRYRMRLVDLFKTKASGGEIIVYLQASRCYIIKCVASKIYLAYKYREYIYRNKFGGYIALESNKAVFGYDLIRAKSVLNLQRCIWESFPRSSCMALTLPLFFPAST